MSSNSKLARKIVKKIEADISDRGGLEDEWGQIDAETKQCIRNTWCRIITTVLDESLGEE